MRQSEKSLLEGSEALAKAVLLSRPDVVSAYPITPQTHIVEALEAYSHSKGRYSFIQADSESAAASIALGASATGARTYTASSSQGILLMAEVLYNIAGLRLPVTITCANRAISAPINIWNDHSDAMAVRDSGWIMLFAQDNQEAIDLQIAAFAIAEAAKLPVMVNVDGFLLTHALEEVCLPSQASVDRFLGKKKPDKSNVLDPKNPMSIGTLFPPEHYSQYRQEMAVNLMQSGNIIQEQLTRYYRICRPAIKGQSGLAIYSGPKRPHVVIIAMGSMLGTIEEAVASRKDRKEIGILAIRSYRPFPAEETKKACSSANKVIVLEKVTAFSGLGPLAQEVATAGIDREKIKNFPVGLGGEDIGTDDIDNIINQAKI